jgi:hypothetical protein
VNIARFQLSWKGEKTLSELAFLFNVRPNLITQCSFGSTRVDQGLEKRMQGTVTCTKEMPIKLGVHKANSYLV